MKRTFRKHQYTMFAYTMREQHPALFVEMRLGKCLVTIRRINLYKPHNVQQGKKVLIVAPSSPISNWETELHLEGCSYTTLNNTREDKLHSLEESFTYYLCNKETFLRVPEIATYWKWDAVVLDESPFIKNAKAKVTKFFTKYFRQVPHRWILTGTPAPEDVMEYFTQLQFLYGRAFGFRNFWQWRAVCFKQHEFLTGVWVPKPGVMNTIRKEIGTKCLIMSRKSVGVEPEKVHMTRRLTLPTDLRKQYKRAEVDFECGESSTIWTTVQYTWLRKLCGGFLDGQFKWDGKLQELIYLLTTELKDQKVVVWFFYNHELFKVQEELTKLGIDSHCMYGALSRDVREAQRKAWATSKGSNVFLVQQAVAQMGMDLSAADTTIFYSEPPGLLASLQVEDRIVSLSKNTSLLYVYLLVQNTVDEDIHNALRSKKFDSNLTLSHALRQAMEARNA